MTISKPSSHYSLKGATAVATGGISKRDGLSQAQRPRYRFAASATAAATALTTSSVAAGSVPGSPLLAPLASSSRP